jgi:hypothetical protein
MSRKQFFVLSPRFARTSRKGQNHRTEIKEVMEEEPVGGRELFGEGAQPYGR